MEDLSASCSKTARKCVCTCGVRGSNPRVFVTGGTFRLGKAYRAGEITHTHTHTHTQARQRAAECVHSPARSRCPHWRLRLQKWHSRVQSHWRGVGSGSWCVASMVCCANAMTNGASVGRVGGCGGPLHKVQPRLNNNT